MLALLGWNPGTDQEIMSLKELTELFDLERVHKGGAKFDPDKTNWFNQQYLRMLPDAELGAQLQARLKEKGIDTTLDRATAAAVLLKERATFVDDMLEGTYLFTSGSPLENASDGAKADLAKRWKPELAPVIELFITMINETAPATADEFHTLFNALLVDTGTKIGQS